MAVMMCPCCKQAIRGPSRIALAQAHLEEDNRLNDVAHAAADHVAKEQMKLYPKNISPGLSALKAALEKFARVAVEQAQTNAVVENLINMEKELGK